MTVGDVGGLIFGAVMFAIGAWFAGAAVFDGTSTEWTQLADGSEGYATVPRSLTERAIFSVWGVLLMTPVAWITASYLRGRFRSKMSVTDSAS